MNKVILYAGLILFSQALVAMDNDTYSRPSKLLFITDNDNIEKGTFHVDIIKRKHFNEKSSPFTVCELRIQNKGVYANSAVGSGYLSLSSDKHEDAAEVIEYLEQNTKGFEQQARMILYRGDRYDNSVIDIDTQDISELRGRYKDAVGSSLQ
jgi:hypothetical protein